MIKAVDTKERRKEPRFPINATVTITSVDGNKTYSGICCDVSRSGLKIEIQEELPLNETLKLEILEKGVVFSAEAVVAHTVKTEKGFTTGFDVNFEPEIYQ